MSFIRTSVRDAYLAELEDFEFDLLYNDKKPSALYMKVNVIKLIKKDSLLFFKCKGLFFY